MDVIKYESVQQKIIEIRGQKVIIDSDVAELYGVETKDINKAVKNNPDKFPDGYIFEISKNEKNELVENFHRFANLKHSTVSPKAFSERGLYMLATILKSFRATATTLAIIETFTKVREISRTIVDVINAEDNSPRQKSLSERVGQLVGDLIMPDESDLETVAVETSTKLKFLSMLEITRTVVKKSKK
jgi:hypothetical protein